jgi:RNA polymerase sigma-70 factor (ECF subfamily)
VNYSEAELLQQALTGDDDAFTLLVEMYQTPVYNMCYRMLSNEMAAEDAAQETFWRAYKALDRYDTSRKFGTWILSIAAHYCIDQQRRKRPVNFSIDEFEEEIFASHEDGPEKSLANQQEDNQLHQVINGLKPKDQAAIILFYWHELSIDEISEMLSMTPSAVKSRLHRARKQIAEKWQSSNLELLPTGRDQNESPVF